MKTNLRLRVWASLPFLVLSIPLSIALYRAYCKQGWGTGEYSNEGWEYYISFLGISIAICIVLAFFFGLLLEDVVKLVRKTDSHGRAVIFTFGFVPQWFAVFCCTLAVGFAAHDFFTASDLGPPYCDICGRHAVKSASYDGGYDLHYCQKHAKPFPEKLVFQVRRGKQPPVWFHISPTTKFFAGSLLLLYFGFFLAARLYTHRRYVPVLYGIYSLLWVLFWAYEFSLYLQLFLGIGCIIATLRVSVVTTENAP